jgi:SAM-dependent methyltransferase
LKRSEAQVVFNGLDPAGGSDVMTHGRSAGGHSRDTRAASFELPSRAELESLFRQKYGSPESTGWSPRRRWRAGYFLPADVYEAVVSRTVFEGCDWLDVGGGHDIFPDNAALARTLVSRCRTVVAVDPSENVHDNTFAHERVRALIEDYRPARQFDVATLRMVVEHVVDPDAVAAALHRLLRPGGLAIVFTVNRWSPITLLSRATPFALHGPIKSVMWGGEDKDTFPVQYKMNSRRTLRRVFAAHGFEESAFAYLDDLSAFGFFKGLNSLELLVWRTLSSLHLRYPENCLLGVYRRN